MARRNKIRPIVKKNLKQFNKAISNFNKNLKYAKEHNKISSNSYEELLIDNDKKNFYKSNIFKESQLKSFLKMINEGTKKSFELSKKPIGMNELYVSKYERNLYMKNYKYLTKYDTLYGTNRAERALYINKNNKDFYLRILQNAKLLVTAPGERFKTNFVESMEENFGNVKFTNVNGEKVDYKYLENLLKSLSSNRLELLLLKDINFKIQMTYVFDKKEIQNQMRKIENSLLEVKRERKLVEQIKKIKDYNKRYKQAMEENDEYEWEDIGEFLVRKGLL